MSAALGGESVSDILFQSCASRACLGVYMCRMACVLSIIEIGRNKA